ncbi:PREDICTED: myotubularin-related protein 14 isoform X2 [Rhagoletis zephyria]|uniref:myotubularin-related protein 14 isoform X2 n=2 Tax=Rhagoletis TaxID=28609 RepID=UPI0008117C17|nr:PREDICTED: myotubularin-related protein 14 isoform X2 [Rhagoletis zephyria]
MLTSNGIWQAAMHILCTYSSSSTTTTPIALFSCGGALCSAGKHKQLANLHLTAGKRSQACTGHLPVDFGFSDSVTLNNCEYLMKLDYSVIDLENPGGALSARYPPRIFIPEYEYGHMASTGSVSTANIPSSCNSTSGYESGNGYTTNGIDLKNFKSIPPQRTRAPAIPSIVDDVNGSSPNGVTSATSVTGHTGNNSNSNGCDSGTGNVIDGDTNIQSFVSVAPKHARPQQSQQKQRTIYEDLYDVSKIRDFITYARYARCRQRFVVPVILYRGKLICRSATLSVVHETYSRYAYDRITSVGTESQQRTNGDENTESSEESSLFNDGPLPFSYSEVIKNDVSLLNTLNVNTIVDLMVEKRKVKYFMTVSSSEKADPENNYDKFNILSLPYPGCEFFKKFRDNNYMANNLHYNWKLPFNDANISIPKIGPAMDLDVNWEDYQKWDLVEITQNYLKAMLKYVQEENTGLLVHCISGWDRTPLFISLLRLSLWADGLIHQSLDYMQITYLTLAYDWYLFGHQLPDREKRGEDIMLFCFHMLKFITGEEFSLVEHRELLQAAIDQDSNDSYSNGEMAINDSFYGLVVANASPPQATTAINNAITSRSPNPKRSRTSPISVPTTRQRQESVSSNGSWQVVTDTGSIDSQITGSYMRNFIAQRSESNSEHSSNGIPLSNGSSSCSSRNSGSDTLDSGSSIHNTSVSSNGSAGSYNGIHMLPTTTEGVETSANADTADLAATMSNRKKLLTAREKRLNAVRGTFIRAYGKGVGLKFREGSSMNIGTLIGTLF